MGFKTQEWRAAAVYAIECVPTGEMYVGATSCVATRFATHRMQIRKSISPNGRLHELSASFGIDQFRFSILEKIETSLGLGRRLLAAERKWRDEMASAGTKIIESDSPYPASRFD